MEHTLRIRINPRPAAANGLPLCLAIALDTSESMEGDKLTRGIESCRAILSELKSKDSLSLATYSTSVSPILSKAMPDRASMERLDSAFAVIEAKGVTRMDLALKYLQDSLKVEVNAARVGILITDGHPTDQKGEKLKDIDFLIQKASNIEKNGVTLLTVGLGNANDFNTAFLVDLCDKAHGAFLYANSPEELKPLLIKRLAMSQAIATEDARITFRSLLPGTTVKAMCRYSPEFSPMDCPEMEKSRRIGSLRADSPTEILANVSIPSIAFGQRAGKANAVEILLNYDSLPDPISAIASILYTSSYSESQQLDKEVDRARLMWEINTNLKELQTTTDTGRLTGLLETVLDNARKTGSVDIEKDARDRLKELKQDGKLDASKTTKLLTRSRETGNIR